MQVRPATPDDTQVLPELHSASVETLAVDAYDGEQVAAWAKRGERAPADYTLDEGYFVVAERVDEVAGFGHLIPDECEVRAVYVHPDHARCGVGTALLAHLEGYARALDLPHLELTSSRNAVGFYERAGYERVEATTHETRPEVALPVTRMRKDIRGQNS